MHNIYVCMCTYIYIYIYIYKEREREREREICMDTYNTYVCIYLSLSLYIYIYIYRYIIGVHTYKEPRRVLRQGLHRQSASGPSRPSDTVSFQIFMFVFAA